MKTFLTTALLSLTLVHIAIAQEHELNIHGEVPLSERTDAGTAKAVDEGQRADTTRGPVTLTLRVNTPGYVTLVIDDEQGVRVRNLISERYFDQGEHVIYWDCLDEAGIPADHPGTYSFLPNLVEPGTYKIRGLFREGINLRYEFSANTAGNPPWRTPDGRGGWLADHSPPSGIVFLPGETPRMLISSFVAESGDGLVWTDLEGNKLAGVRGVGAGGHWCGGYLLARDSGEGAPEAYLAVSWKGRIELWSIHPHRDIFGRNKPASNSVQGIAVRNGLAVLSLDEANKLLLIDTASGKIYAEPALERPRGLAFDQEGRLLAVSGSRLLRLSLPENVTGISLPEPETVIESGLEDASQVAIDADGRIYIGIQGDLHQVKVYSSKGEFLHAIGDPGGVQLGPYNPRRMHNPVGLAITPDQRLWVAEDSQTPKRISVWSLDGTLEKWMVGPPQYGAGGTLSADKKRFYYGGSGNAGLEFAVDWEAGTAELANIYYLPGGPGDIGLNPGAWVTVPQNPLVVDGREYMVNAWSSQPTHGVDSLGIWRRREDGIAIPVAAIGRPEHLPILRGEEFQARRQPSGNQLFAWSDLNDDGQIQPDEVTFLPEIANAGEFGPLNIGPDLTVINSNSLILRPQGFTAGGAPIYDAADFQLPIEDLIWVTGSTGGGQALLGEDGHVIITGGPMRGFLDGKLSWTYPSRWPSLHGSHWGAKHRIARIPAASPGMMIGTTRLIGPLVSAPRGEAGEMWAISGNLGEIYLMTTDGLFVASLFQDIRVPGARDRVPSTARGTLFNDVSLGVENFWPAIAATSDGEVYVTSKIAAGGTLVHSSVFHVEGLDSVKRFDSPAFKVTASHLAAAYEALLAGASEQIADAGRATLAVPILDTDITVDGNPKEWPRDRWTRIGELPFQHRWRELNGQVTVANGRLCVAFKTDAFTEMERLTAVSDDPAKLLTEGAGIEIALATDPDADPERREAAAGDLRLIISRYNDKPIALLYEAVAPDAEHGFEVTADWRSMRVARVVDLSAEAQIAASRDALEASIPLAALGIDPRPGDSIRADFGILRRMYRVMDSSGRLLRVLPTFSSNGHDEQVLHRIYWHNPATGFAPDAPGAARFNPQLWGTWKVE